MSEKDRKDFAIIAAGVIIALILWWIWSRRQSMTAAQSAENTQGNNGAAQPSEGKYPPWAYWGSGNGPFSQGGMTPQAAALFSLYNIPLPNFGYAGNSQIYMPLYGFVGYSSVGTY